VDRSPKPIANRKATLYGAEVGEIFNAWTIDSVFNTNFQKPISAPPLMTTKKQDLNRFVIRLHILKGVVPYVMRRVINDYLPNAKKLISLMQNEYHLQ